MRHPTVVLDNGKISTASWGKQYSMMHIQWLSEDFDEIMEIMDKVAKACQAMYPTKECPVCKGTCTTLEDTAKHRNCSNCEGHGIVPDPEALEVET